MTRHERSAPGARRKLPALISLLLLVVSTGALCDTPPQAMHHYQLLEQALTQYRELAKDPSLTALPAMPTRSIQPNGAYAGAAALRRLLVAVGDIAPNDPASPDPTLLDEALVAGLKRFQLRHGLMDDGVLGGGTWRALTTPLSKRVRQIERTLARWQQLPANPHKHAIFINIPRYRLYAMDSMDEREAQMLQIDVVVGRTVARLRTPTFMADMTHLIFQPYWDAPRSIAVNELLPAARKDPRYLSARNFEVVTAQGAIVAPTSANLEAVASGKMRLRQQPGAQNALGKVKFVLPNPHSVYLHDTPARDLFTKPRRAYSHGCIRVSDPLALAEFVLRDDPTWTRERIAQAMNGTLRLQVDLKEPIRVYIVYGTAIAREDGTVLFLEDVYGLDKL
jgi:murein L,D-transpeptidase YcbB/YkuD